LASTAISYDDGGFINITSGLPLYFGDFTCGINLHYDYPYLQSETVTEYDENGANPMTVVTNYTYDGYRNKKTESYTSSKNEPVVKSYNYAADAISGISTATQTAQTAMVQAGMVGIPLEQVETRSGTQTGHSRMDYQSFPAGFGFLAPGESWKSSYTAALDPLTQYVNFDNLGNVSEYITRDGLTTCYDWGYNQSYPVVKIINANNTQYTYAVTTTNTGSETTAIWAPGVVAGKNIPITYSSTGTLNFSAGFSEEPASTDQVTYTVTLQGQGPISGVFYQTTICIGGSGVTCSVPGGSSFTGLPVGTYNLFVTPQTTGVGSSFNYYQTTYTTTYTTTGSKNYFYDGFEENSNVAVVSGTAHTGDLYWGGSSYTPGFTPPDNNAYTIEWWALSGGSWVYHTQAYSSGMSVTGPVDDVRIFPAGAMMSTYTYRPLVGMTSEIDPRGYTSYFTYDAFSRLSTELDKDRNVLKRYCYNYTGQSTSCPLYTTPPQESVNVSNTTNEANLLIFTNQTTSDVLTYTVAAGTQQLLKLPSGTYGVTIGPVSPVSGYPINYTINGLVQTYFATVGYSNVAITGASTVTIAPPAEENVNVTNTSTEALTLAFTYNPGSYSYTYTFSVPANYSGVVGTVPSSTSYGVTMGPVSPNSNYPLVYNINGLQQTYYATVGYTGVSITSAATVTVGPLPPVAINVTNSTNATLTIKYTNSNTNQVYSFTANPLSNGTVGTLPQGQYSVTIGPTTYSPEFPINYSLDGLLASYYATVEYGSITANGTQTLLASYPAVESVVVNNTSNRNVTLTFTNAYGYSYTFTSIQGSSESVGTVFAGTYNVFMTPSSPATSYPILWTINGISQEYYAEVEFGGIVVNGKVTINVSFY